MTWFRKPLRRSAPRQLNLEPLEERRVPTVAYQGGSLLPHVEIEPVYYGNFWSTATGQQQASDLNNFLGYLVNSPYVDMLAEYGVGRGSLPDNGVAINGPVSGQIVSDRQIQRLLATEIAQGKLPAPDGNRLYVVYTPPGVEVSYQHQLSAVAFYGYHDSFVNAAGQSIYYAVMPHPIGNGDIPGLNDFDTLTAVTSHEVAESITDPDGGGWYDPQTGDEIGDVSQTVGYRGGYALQVEWSNLYNAAVLPPAATSAASPALDALGRVADAFAHSDEYFRNLVQQDYLQYLGRGASPAEIAGWVSDLQAGQTDEQIAVCFLASTEFYQRAGGSDRSWVDQLYQDVLSRAPDGAGESGWLQLLSRGASHDAVAAAFIASPEHEGRVIVADYVRYLGRSASAAEVAGWVNVFEQGATNEDIVSAMVATPEFFHDYRDSNGTWLTGIYQTVLQRSPDETGYDAWSAYLADPNPFRPPAAV